MTGQADEPKAPAQTAAAGASGSLPGGRVGRPHGLDGSFYVTRPRPRLLRIGVVVTVAERSAAIVRLAGTEQRPIVRLEGVEDRAAAEALRGTELLIDGGDAPALGEQEWWAHELEGCEVLDGGQLLGTVSRLIELPSCEALEVRPADGGAVVLVPMVKDAVRRVAPAQRRIEVDLEFLGLAERAGAHQ
ncbi:MAG: ribosome maturation factor RimM [Solirubrobacteraceae bacterium]